MKKQPKADKLLNMFHKGFVWSCIGVTVVGTGLLGFRFYKYFTDVKPQLKQKELQDQLLAEGASDALRDIAPSLKA